MILAGDLGGTKCALILFEVEGQRLRSVYRVNALTAEFSNVESFFDSFRERAGNAGYRLKDGDLAFAGFGVAGAIVNEEVVCNNLPWTIDRKRVAESLK